MTVLWTAAEAAKATGVDAAGLQGSDAWQASGVSIDTRTIRPGDLFVALKDLRDGHDFVAMAFEKGAAAALVTHRPAGVAEDAPLLVVPDVLKALEDMGRFARARTDARVVAITGSVGKTSTKEMLRIVLAGQGRTHAAEASYNNHWGVPLTLARMPADTEFAVIEIGMSGPGEISPLAIMARPHVAMITTVAAAHLEAFGRIEGIAAEKASILDGVEPGGVAILNGDIPTRPILADYARKTGVAPLWFGHDDADWVVGHVRLAHDATVISASHAGADYLFKLSVAGRHFAMNAVGVLAVAEALGADPVAAALDIAGWVPPAGRGTRETLVLDPAMEEDTLDLIDDAFNANPTSLTAALEVLAATRPKDGLGRKKIGRRIAFLGDMLELGETEMADHAAIAHDRHIAGLSIIHCAGPRMKHLWDALPEHQRGHWTATAAELADKAARLVDAGDVVLVKGSKGSKVSLVVDAIRKLGHRRAQQDT